jgi:hypothetical protein
MYTRRERGTTASGRRTKNNVLDFCNVGGNDRDRIGVVASRNGRLKNNYTKVDGAKRRKETSKNERERGLWVQGD